MAKSYDELKLEERHAYLTRQREIKEARRRRFLPILRQTVSGDIDVGRSEGYSNGMTGRSHDYEAAYVTEVKNRLAAGNFDGLAELCEHLFGNDNAHNLYPWKELEDVLRGVTPEQKSGIDVARQKLALQKQADWKAAQDHAAKMQVGTAWSYNGSVVVVTSFDGMKARVKFPDNHIEFIWFKYLKEV